MYVTKYNDVRMCDSVECNTMSIEQHNTWRKKMRTVDCRAKKAGNLCYRSWKFIAFKPRTRKISHNSADHPDLEEVTI